MTDTRSKSQRRKIMQAVGQKNTGPELKVRKALHKLGYRYRVNLKGLPGRPDIAFPTRKKAIFIHGCFWHAHGCSKGQPPKSRLEYWAGKLSANVNRDERNRRDLQNLGWEVLTLWQCEINDFATLETVKNFLGPIKFDRQTIR